MAFTILWATWLKYTYVITLLHVSQWLSWMFNVMVPVGQTIHLAKWVNEKTHQCNLKVV